MHISLRTDESVKVWIGGNDIMDGVGTWKPHRYRTLLGDQARARDRFGPVGPRAATGLRVWLLSTGYRGGRGEVAGPAVGKIETAARWEGG